MVNYDTADTSSIETRLNELNDPSKTTFNNAERGEVLDAVTLLQTRVNNNPATTLENTSESLQIVKQKILEAQEDLKIAEDRVKSLRNVDKKRSYYESWFPINRPLRSSSIIICFIFGIFFFSLSFFMFMRYLGVSFTVDIRWLTPGNMEIYSRLLPYGAGFIIIALIVLAVISWVRKS
jgi:hypothetical protein